MKSFFIALILMMPIFITYPLLGGCAYFPHTSAFAFEVGALVTTKLDGRQGIVLRHIHRHRRGMLNEVRLANRENPTASTNVSTQAGIITAGRTTFPDQNAYYHTEMFNDFELERREK